MTSYRAAERIAPALRNTFDAQWGNLINEIICRFRPKPSHVDIPPSVRPCEPGEDGAVPTREDVYKHVLSILVQEVIQEQRMSREQGRQLLAELAAKEN
jgi:hypothetical protein